jgi:hypothetical protein
MSERSDLLSRRNRKTVKELRQSEASAVVVEKIHDIEAYDPSKADTNVLHDDLRIALSWYSSWSDPDLKIQFTREQVKGVLKRIVAELVKRGVTEFKLGTLDVPAREILEEVVRELASPDDGSVEKNGEPVSAPSSGPHPTPRNTNTLTPEITAGLSDDELKEVANELAELWGSMFGSAVAPNKIGETVSLPLGHVESLKTREKRLVLSTEPIVSTEPVVLASDDGMAHGLLSLGPPQEFSKEQLSTGMKTLHLVSDEEMSSRWPEAQTLFSHEVRGAVWFASPIKLTGKELSVIKKLSQEDLINAAIFLLDEAAKRGVDLGFPPDLLRAVELLRQQGPAQDTEAPAEDEVEKETIASPALATSGKKNPARAKYDSHLVQKADGVDQYMVKQKGSTKYPFAVQHHFRGVWSQAERQQLQTGLRDAIELSKTNEEESRKLVSDLWKKYEPAIMKTSLDAISRAAQDAADNKGDVPSSVKNLLDDSPPAPVDLQRILPNIVNKGNVHTDFRMRSPEGDWLIGWTMDTPGIVLQTLDGKLLKLLRSKFVENEPQDNILAQRKDKQPKEWLTIVRPGSAVFRAEPGEVGGTAKAAGEFRFVDRGEVIFGAQKSDYHELFLFFEKNKKLNGRWGAQLLRGQAEEASGEFWMINRPSDTQAPYITTHDYEKEVEKAQSEDAKLIWNSDAITALKAAGYEALPTNAEEAMVVEKSLIPIFKAAEERTVFGIVMEPETIDAHGDVVGKEEIRNAAYNYMEFYQLKGFQHGKSSRWPAFPEGVRLLESYIAPVDFDVNGRHVKEGTWLIRMRVDHEGLWQDVKGGRVTGFSIGGFARGVLEQRAS